jgi:hypothetical protein
VQQKFLDREERDRGMGLDTGTGKSERLYGFGWEIVWGVDEAECLRGPDLWLGMGGSVGIEICEAFMMEEVWQNVTLLGFLRREHGGRVEEKFCKEDAGSRPLRGGW